MSRLRSSPSSQVNEKVDNVVQEYMDVLLADLFPISDTSAHSESDVENLPEQPEFQQATDSVIKVKEQAEALLKTVEPLETQEPLDTAPPEVPKSEPVAPSSQTQSVILDRVKPTDIQALPQEAADEGKRPPPGQAADERKWPSREAADEGKWPSREAAGEGKWPSAWANVPAET